MSERGLNTKNKILQEAKKLFIKKSYAAVTMSDICDATQLSRGGLYRHYSSTKEIFEALLMSDKDDWEEETKKAMACGISAIKMIDYYFEKIYKDILNGEGWLSLATYEYGRTGQDKDNFLSKRYDYAVNMMEQLLEYGQSQGEFASFDPHLEAVHMVIYLEGLKTASVGVPLSNMCIKQQLTYLQDRLRKEQ